MNSIGRSGLYQNDVGESFLVTQGLVGYTLVAGKQILFRLFSDQAVVPLVDYMVVTIEGAGKTIGVFVTKAYLIVENDLPNGPSVGVVLQGFAFPKAGTYSVTIVPYTNQGAPLAKPTLLSMSFLPTKDLRFLVNYMYHEGVFGPTPDWDTDVHQSMLRLGSMFPVRDCVQSKLNGDTRHGLRYTLGNSCDGWTDTYYKCVYEQTKAINAAAGDDVDVTIEFRWGLYAPQWNPPGDPSPGGNSGRPPGTLQQSAEGGVRGRAMERT